MLYKIYYIGNKFANFFIILESFCSYLIKHLKFIVNFSFLQKTLKKNLPLEIYISYKAFPHPVRNLFFWSKIFEFTNISTFWWLDNASQLSYCPCITHIFYYLIFFIEWWYWKIRINWSFCWRETKCWKSNQWRRTSYRRGRRREKRRGSWWWTFCIISKG